MIRCLLFHGGVIALALALESRAQERPLPPLPVPSMPVPEIAGGEQAVPVVTERHAVGPVEGAVRPDAVRDPFWPVGYVPKVVAVKKAVPETTGAVSPLPKTILTRLPQWDEAQKQLDIRGISLIGRDKATNKPKYLAVVTGRLVEAGQVVSVTYEGMVYRWKVVGIDESGISFQKIEVQAGSN